MFFQQKKEPIDIRDLPRNIPTGKRFVPKDGYGFVDLTVKRKLPSEIAKEKALMKSVSQPVAQTSTSSFSFFDTPSATSPYPTAAQTYSTPVPSNSDTEEMLRKISLQISDLDTKIYKMEQRIELLERKAGVSTPSSSGFSW